MAGKNRITKQQLKHRVNEVLILLGELKTTNEIKQIIKKKYKVSEKTVEYYVNLAYDLLHSDIDKRHINIVKNIIDCKIKSVISELYLKYQETKDWSLKLKLISEQRKWLDLLMKLWGLNKQEILISPNEKSFIDLLKEYGDKI